MSFFFTWAFSISSVCCVCLFVSQVFINCHEFRNERTDGRKRWSEVYYIFVIFLPSQNADRVGGIFSSYSHEPIFSLDQLSWNLDYFDTFIDQA